MKGRWRLLVLVVLAALPLPAGKVVPFQPTGETDRNVWTLPLSPKDLVMVHTGAHFVAVSTSQTSQSPEMKVWINGSFVWEGRCCVENAAVDSSGNWLIQLDSAPPLGGFGDLGERGARGKGPVCGQPAGG